MADQKLSVPYEPSNWPKTVGVISIIWALLLLCCNSCGFFAGAIQNFFINMVPPDQQDAARQRAAANAPTTVNYILMGIGFPVAVWLLAAGITTVRRRPAGRPMHLVYGLMALALWAANAVVYAMKLPEQIKVSQQQAGPAHADMVAPISYAMFAAIMLVFLIWPLFCTIWFGLVKRDGRDLDGGPEVVA